MKTNQNCRTFSRKLSGTFLPLTLDALSSSFLASSFLPWARSQRADSGRYLVETPTLLTRHTQSSYMTPGPRPVENSPNDGQRTEQHQQQDPPIRNQVGNGRQNHQARRGDQHDGRRAQGRLRGGRPLQTLRCFHQKINL